MLTNILNKSNLTFDDLVYLLSLTDDNDLQQLFDTAYSAKIKYTSNKAYYRGLIEFSNICIKDCLYCGIRKSNTNVERFNMDISQIREMAQWAYDNNYGSITLQSGERTDKQFIDFCTEAIKVICEVSNNTMGITLCLGEQTQETYKWWRETGATRYLLRIETTNQELYKQIHPLDDLHSFNNRVNCLNVLKSLDYQVGTGVMIGLPNQTIEDLANDIMFFKQHDIDMIGMGPYIVQSDTPMGIQVNENNQNTDIIKKERFLLGLKMIAVCRLYLKDINIAATTALQAIDPLGREKGLKAGANILMPIITLPQFRAKYQLYDDKPCIEDTSDQCKACLTARVSSVGDVVGFGERGDSPHYFNRNNK